MRHIGVVTTARSDYGIYRPVLRAITETSGLDLQLFVSGLHLAPEFGLTVSEIEADGFPIAERVEMLLASDSPTGIAKSIGLGVLGFADVFARIRPDILLVLGDRFEMYAAALAAMPHVIPIAHLHGGEVTEGQFDEAIRHSLTKMSHLHFVATEAYRRRVIQLGEAPARVFVTGAPGLDNVRQLPVLDRAQLEDRLQLPLDPAPLVVTLHPVTLQHADTPRHAEELSHALDAAGLPIVFTYPNADTGSRAIIDAIREYVGAHRDAVAVENLGSAAYFSLLRHARAMVGNSSSGLIEAASFGLPVVNIGDRQRGRVRGANVIDVACERRAILQGITRATDAAFRAVAASTSNPYGDGHAGERIASLLQRAELGHGLVMKRFHDLAATEVALP